MTIDSLNQDLDPEIQEERDPMLHYNSADVYNNPRINPSMNNEANHGYRLNDFNMPAVTPDDGTSITVRAPNP